VATETIEIYAPIAHRLGMGKVRGEFEDLAFRHLDPEAFEEIAQTIESKRHSNEEFLNEIRTPVESELRREGIPARCSLQRGLPDLDRAPGVGFGGMLEELRATLSNRKPEVRENDERDQILRGNYRFHRRRHNPGDCGSVPPVR